MKTKKAVAPKTTKQMLDAIASELHTSITEYSWTHPDGTCVNLPYRKPNPRSRLSGGGILRNGSECTAVEIAKKGASLIKAAKAAGFKEGWNNPGLKLGRCYMRPSSVKSKWGNIVQVWSDGRIRIVIGSWDMIYDELFKNKKKEHTHEHHK